MTEVTNLAILPQKKPKNALRPKAFTFLRRLKNPQFENGLTPLEIGNPENPLFESCLITTKSHNFEPKIDKKPIQEYEVKRAVLVRTEPKWKTDLLQEDFDSETGECLRQSVYQTNDFKVSNGKKIKRLDQFCNHYQPLYKKKEVTLWFLTFTRANYSRLSFKQMNHIVVNYFKRSNISVRGFIWTYEISDSFHWHYHLCLATDRVNIRGKALPTKLKFDALWGQRTDLEFVKKDIRHYMAKYFSKCDFRLNNGLRSYGASKRFI